MADRPSHPPRFKNFQAPRALPRPAVGGPGSGPRPSPHDRGLDDRWSRLSTRFARQNPFCRMCGQEGNDTVLGDVRDHIKPRREYPDLTYVWGNIQNICRRHDGLKARMEAHARATGQLEKVPFWCEALENRPPEIAAIPPELWGNRSISR